MNKKNILLFFGTLPAGMLLFLLRLASECEQHLVSFLRKPFLRWLVVWSQQKNYLENTLCQLTVQRAHKQDHLAIISSQSQIHTAKPTFIKKNGQLWERRKIGQVEREGQERELGGGGLLELGRGHGVPVERNSGKHP